MKKCWMCEDILGKGYEYKHSELPLSLNIGYDTFFRKYTIEISDEGHGGRVLAQEIVYCPICRRKIS